MSVPFRANIVGSPQRRTFAKGPNPNLRDLSRGLVSTIDLHCSVDVHVGSDTASGLLNFPDRVSLGSSLVESATLVVRLPKVVVRHMSSRVV